MKQKNVIEWVEDPYSGKRNEIEIKIGENFIPKNGINIPITKELFDEIAKYIQEDEEMLYYIKPDSMTFRLDKKSGT